jgi:putative ABC transport system substrate-binding protein
MLKALVPTLGRVWAVYYAEDPSSRAAVRKALEAAPLLQLDLVAQPVRTSQELATALQALRPGDGLPAVFSTPLRVTYGGLGSYGTDYDPVRFQAARRVAKILHGARPQELPVESADQIELAVNLKTAERLGLTVPYKVLLRADKTLR